MAKKAKTTAKKVVKKAVQKVLDSTELDEQIIAGYSENKDIINKVLCYIKCYGGYIVAVGAGCSFGVSFVWGTILLAAAAGWAYKTRACKGGSC